MKKKKVTIIKEVTENLRSKIESLITSTAIELWDYLFILLHSTI